MKNDDEKKAAGSRRRESKDIKNLPGGYLFDVISERKKAAQIVLYIITLRLS